MTHKKKLTRIAIIGAGFGGVYALKALHKQFHNNPSVKLTLINKTNYFLFTPLLHEAATGGIQADNIVEPLRKVFHCCNINIIIDTVTKVSFETQTLHLDQQRDIPYDYLIMAPGAKTNFFGTPGADTHAFTLKTLDDANTLRRRFIHIVEQAEHMKRSPERTALLHIAIIGGGATGVELAAEAAEFFFESMKRYYKKELLEDV
ncbi:MAG: FAD-dependent oxidoreductase, partial [Candidatus Magasanikbacteria bacterium CG10_big_fil_rev_8_21_14_0_10_43_6]